MGFHQAHVDGVRQRDEQGDAAEDEGEGSWCNAELHLQDQRGCRDIGE